MKRKFRGELFLLWFMTGDCHEIFIKFVTGWWIYYFGCD